VFKHHLVGHACLVPDHDIDRITERAVYLSVDSAAESPPLGHTSYGLPRASAAASQSTRRLDPALVRLDLEIGPRPPHGLPDGRAVVAVRPQHAHHAPVPRRLPRRVALGGFQHPMVGLRMLQDVVARDEHRLAGVRAGIVVFENRWVLSLFEAWRRGGARLIDDGGIPAEAVLAALDATEPTSPRGSA
jgi:hypothetical protein